MRRHRTLILLGRTLRLVCPHCGHGSLRGSWLGLRRSCPACGLQLDRGEPDYWLGAMMFNLIATEMLFAGGLIAALLLTWPDPPWTLLTYGGVVLMVLGPIAGYPFTKVGWLAFDLAFRPLRPEDLRPAEPGLQPGGRAEHPKEARDSNTPAAPARRLEG